MKRKWIGLFLVFVISMVAILNVNLSGTITGNARHKTGLNEQIHEAESKLKDMVWKTDCTAFIRSVCENVTRGNFRIYNCLEDQKLKIREQCPKILPLIKSALDEIQTLKEKVASQNTKPKSQKQSSVTNIVARASTQETTFPKGRKPLPNLNEKYPASYFPNTELLGPNEMRITALGTGMPNQTKEAVSISYMVELGNGDIFIFDAGLGMMGNLFSLRPDFARIDKVFVSHLHIDHVGDFMGLHIGGWLSGRFNPIHIYGPTGSTSELGTKAFVEGMKNGYAWDLATRTGALPDKGAEIIIHEFDYKQENKVVYEKNGVVIRSWPAIHSLDGSVSYSLEWNGLKYVFGGDTYPNKWYIKYAVNADVASHEAFLPPKTLAEYFGWSLRQATYVSTRVHTEPQAFGKVMSAVKPRLAVGYHSVQSPENNAAITDGIRKTYSGPLALARDLMVINVTKQNIVVRMAIVDGYVLPPDVSETYIKAPRTKEKSPSKYILEGKWKDYTPPPMPKN